VAKLIIDTARIKCNMTGTDKEILEAMETLGKAAKIMTGPAPRAADGRLIVEVTGDPEE